MRRSIAILSTLALLGTITACSSTTAPKGSEAAPAAAITIWADDKRAPELEAVKADFVTKTKIEVKIVQKSEADMDKEFISQVPTGKGPDLIVMAHDKLGALVKNGVVGTYDLTDKAKDFAGAAVAGVTYDGQTYGVPYAIESVAVIRNNALTKAEPKSFDEMITAGKAAGKQYPFIVQMGDKGDPYHFYAFQTSFGAPVFKQDAKGSYTKELSLGGDSGTKFATWLADQGKAKVLDPNITGDIAKQAFLDGKAPFILTGPWNVPDFVKANLDISVIPVPAPGANPAQPFVGVQVFFPSAKTTNGIAVTKFLDWVAESSTQDALATAGKRLPAQTQAAANLKDPVMKSYAEVAAKGVPMPAIPEMGKVWDFWGVTEVDIVTGRQAPDAGWTKMVENIDTAIKGS